MNGLFAFTKASISMALFVSVLTTPRWRDHHTDMPVWWTTHALVKILPADRPSAEVSRVAKIAAARNEFEPFQIVLRAEEGDLVIADAQPSDLRNAAGGTIARDHVRIYLERYASLQRSSAGSKISAEWPDPLVPRIDQYYGERRSAFPFTLSKGRSQPLWVEVYVPPGTAPGTFHGQVQISVESGGKTVVPIQLEVWNFTLPSTATYRTSFGLAGASLLKQHRGSFTSDEDLDVLTKLYAKAMLWHRVSFHGGSFRPPEVAYQGDTIRLDWTAYDREIAPFMNGTVFSRGEPLPGARITSIDLRGSNKADTDDRKEQYWRQWVRHFEDKGWLDRLYLYLPDEPARKDFPKVKALARQVRRSEPRLRTLLTASFDRSLADSVDIWTPLINCTEQKPGFPDYCEHAVARDAYDEVLRAGKELWWYQSCASHGCKEGDDEYFRGWPNYVIDGSAVANRIMPWISWKYSVPGELYYNVTEAPDPWNDIYLFGGNGDGTLFYPGKPELVGGTNDIPVESIRLKLIREGIEDYEYMAFLAARGGSRLVDAQVSGMVRSAYDWQSDPQQLYEARKLLAKAIEETTPNADHNLPSPPSKE